MQTSRLSYESGASFVHRLDARVKVALLAVFSIAVFCVSTWAGMLLALIAFVLVFLVSRLPVGKVLKTAFSVYAIVGLAIILNSLTYGGVEASTATMLSGAIRGCFFGLRILLLTWASIVVSFTTSASEIVVAAGWFMRPLRKLGVDVDDAAVMVSLAVRFIPLAAEEIRRVRDAQWSRGGQFSEGGVIMRIKSWLKTFVPLLVGLFRRADALALAMDAKCYGAADRRTLLAESKFGMSSLVVLAFGSAFCLALGFWL